MAGRPWDGVTSHIRLAICKLNDCSEGYMGVEYSKETDNYYYSFSNFSLVDPGIMQVPYIKILNKSGKDRHIHMCMWPHQLTVRTWAENIANIWLPYIGGCRPGHTRAKPG